MRAYILNRDLGYRFEVEPARHAFTAFRVNEYGSPVWAKPRKYEPAKRSGKTVHNYIDTIDTGERRELFGYKMSYRPGDHITVPMKIAFASLVGSEDTGNVSCHGRLFGQNRNCTGIARFHL